MKIFYSWQMDAPRKVNKDFIHGALSQAVDRLTEQLNVSEAERGDIKVDQDTQGILGSPDIVRVILEKIAHSNVVVADVSLVAVGKGSKKHINSNVAIELGYTYGRLGDQALLKVMNTHYGAATELPFDLRTRRHPIQYCLAPDASRETIRIEQNKLAGQLAAILKLYLEQPSRAANNSHVETPSTAKRGWFWANNEVIVPHDDRYMRPDAYANFSSVVYFRCIPKIQLAELSSQQAYDAAVKLRPLLSSGGYSPSRNKWGAVSHSIAKDGELIGFTQLFKNNEIWGVDAYHGNIFAQPEDEDENPKQIIPTGALQRDYPQAIRSMLKSSKELGYGEILTVEMGISGASGMHLAIDSRYWNSTPGPLFDDEVFIRQDIPRDTPAEKVLSIFWEKVFAEAGGDAPDELKWQTQS